MNTFYVIGLVALNAVSSSRRAAMSPSGSLAEHRIDSGTMTTALLLSTQIIAMSGWVAFEVMSIFENVGLVQEGMKTIARPLTLQDQARRSRA